MAPVTSKSTTWFNATAPTEDSTGPSIAGRVSHVMASSSQLQPVIGWMRPPESLLALVTLATCSRTVAEITGRAPTPLTCTRRKVCLVELASTDRSAAWPKLVEGRAESTKVSATIAAVAPAGAVAQVQFGWQSPGHAVLAPSHCSVAWLTMPA